MLSFSKTPSNLPKIGHVVRYIWKSKPCVIIADRENPHKYNYGVKELDEPGMVREVPTGYDYTIVETGGEFSPYIDVKAGEIEFVIPPKFIAECRAQLPVNPSNGDSLPFAIRCDDGKMRLVVFQFVNNDWISNIAEW